MVTFGFLIIWVPGLIFHSKHALLAACFNHTYIWVHYYTTELPDIPYIYGSRNKQIQMDCIHQFREWQHHWPMA